MEENKNLAKGKAIASLVLGIVGTIVGVLWVPLIGIICGIIGIVLGVSARKTTVEQKGMATAGLVLSIISLAASVIVWIISAILIASVASMFL